MAQEATRAMTQMLVSLADERLRSLGGSLDALASCATGIFAFGSRADGSGGPASDLDILCIGIGKRVKRGDLDIVWVPPQHLTSAAWVGSELAMHVARFGVCLHGDRRWTITAQPTHEAVHLKRRAIEVEHLAMLRLWDQLAPEYRVKHMSSVRRNVQRLEHLCRGEAVPPTPHLDAAWHRRNQADDLVAVQKEVSRVLHGG